jgi:hypothetical protein
VRLVVDELRGGSSLDALFQDWNEFIRPSDRICTWGHYAPRLFLRSGGTLPGTPIDIRQEARRREGGKVGTLHEVAGAADAIASAHGRGGERLSQLVSIVRAMARSSADRGE